MQGCCAPTTGPGYNPGTLASHWIPFNLASLHGNEAEYIRQSLEHRHISAGGPFATRVEKFLESALAGTRALMTTSCTHALEMAAILLDVGPGDEVIVPSFAFVSTVNAFVLRGATPVFADVRPDTLNIDEARLGSLVSDRTVAIVPLHYAGVVCEMDAINAIAAGCGAHVVEDAAHALFARFNGHEAGTLGALATLSFHETKNFTCGEGGAILVNDPALVERAEIIRDKGTDRSRFFRGQVDKYTWVDVGSSYGPSDLLAAFLLAQFEMRHEIQQRRKVIWDTYDAGLREWAQSFNIRQPIVPGHCVQGYHMYYLLMHSLDERQAFIRHLEDRGVNAVFHYQALNLSTMGQRLGGSPGQCPVAEDVCDRLVRLPFYTSMTESENQEVIEAVVCFGR